MGLRCPLDRHVGVKNRRAEFESLGTHHAPVAEKAQGTELQPRGYRFESDQALQCGWEVGISRGLISLAKLVQPQYPATIYASWAGAHP